MKSHLFHQDGKQNQSNSKVLKANFEESVLGVLMQISLTQVCSEISVFLRGERRQMGRISTGNLKAVLLSFSFQLNGKFWQPSHFKSVQNRFKKLNIFSQVGFFNPVKRRRRSHPAQVRCYRFFFPLRRKKTKYSNNLTSGHVLFSEQLSTVFHFCFFPVCSLLFTFSWHLSFVNGVAS